MSFVDKNQNICFIHIAKNAGKSISTALVKEFPPSKVYCSGDTDVWGDGSGHFTYHQALHDFPEASKKWYAFAVIRNPLDRLLSAFHYISTPNHPIRFDRFVENIEQDYNSFKWSSRFWWQHYCHQKLNHSCLPPHIVPYSFYFSDDHDIDLFSFDRIDEISLVFKEKFNQELYIPRIGRQAVFTEVSGWGGKNRAEVSKETLKKIEKIYEKDFEIYERVCSCSGPYNSKNALQRQDSDRDGEPLGGGSSQTVTPVTTTPVDGFVTKVRTKSEAALYLLIAGHVVSDKTYRLDGSSLEWDVPLRTFHGVPTQPLLHTMQTFSFTLAEPSGADLGTGRSTAITPDDMVGYLRANIGPCCSPPDTAYGAAFYKKLQVDATYGRMVIDQALRFLPDGATHIPTDVLRDPSINPAFFSRLSLERLLKWFTELEEVYDLCSANVPRLLPVSCYVLPEGFFELENEEKEPLLTLPFSFEHLTTWKPFAELDGYYLIRHPRGAVAAIQMEDEQVTACRIIEGHDALSHFITYGFGLNETQGTQLDLVMRPGRPLLEVLSELGHINLLQQIRCPGNRIQHIMLVTLTRGMYRQFVLFAVTDIDGILLGSKRVEWNEGYEQFALVLADRSIQPEYFPAILIDSEINSTPLSEIFDLQLSLFEVPEDDLPRHPLVGRRRLAATFEGGVEK